LAGGAAAAGAAVALAGCGSSSGTGGSTTTGSTGTTGTTATTTTTGSTSTTSAPHLTAPTAADWNQLESKLQGRLVRPGNPAFAADSVIYNPVFDAITPQAVAICTSPGDVAACIAFVRNHLLPLAIRGGGHSYGGYSTGTGLVLDVSGMAGISVGEGASNATVAAGARLVDVYSACADAGVAIPGGSCPTVGISGLTLGGGVGVIGRQFGLACDNLLSAEVVLADGSTVTASAGENSDLFWALRGAGGGNFGVVTSLEFRTHPIGSLGLFTLVYEWADAASVLAAWQSFAPAAPEALWSNCLLLASQSTPSGFGPVARVTGVYVGSESALEADLQPFRDAVGASPFTDFVGSAPYLQAMLIEAGCDGDTVPECHLPSQNPAGVLTRAPFAAKSDYLATALPRAGIETVLAAVEQRQASPVLSGGGIAFDAAGGAINAIAPDATAFVHRNQLASLQYSGNWPSGAAASLVAANRAWLESTWRSMRPYVSGQAYQNYIDPALPDWQQAYYGSNLARLEQVKAKYDPDDVFHFQQGIPLV
jgi:FAD/FMN-containing dehydrogenase